MQQDALESVRSSLLGDKIRNEEANNSKRNRISSLKFSHFLLYRRTSILRDLYFYTVFHDLFLNWLSRAEYACINTQNQGPRFEGNYAIAKEQTRDEHCASFQREGNRGRNKCRNCFWDRYWGQQSQKSFRNLTRLNFLPVSRFSSIACKEALHLGESGGVTQESQAKGDAIARGREQVKRLSAPGGSLSTLLEMETLLAGYIKV